jgi:hypothetical protein
MKSEALEHSNDSDEVPSQEEIDGDETQNFDILTDLKTYAGNMNTT